MILGGIGCDRQSHLVTGERGGAGSDPAERRILRFGTAQRRVAVPWSAAAASVTALSEARSGVSPKRLEADRCSADAAASSACHHCRLQSARCAVAAASAHVETPSTGIAGSLRPSR